MSAWDRQPGETGPAYEAFCAYRDQGKARTALAAFRQIRSRPEATDLPGLWTSWCAKNHWRERAHAYDAYIEQQAREQADQEAIKRRAEMLKRHRQAGELLTRRGIEHFAQQQIDSARDAISAIKTGVDLERQAEGLPAWVGEIMTADADRLRAIVTEVERGLAALESPGDAAALGAGAGPVALRNGHH
jgi:ATP-dependent exoDNAse (exonuclease V) beta subunit